MTEYTDDEVFGSPQAAPQASSAPREYSDEEVFGKAAATAPAKPKGGSALEAFGSNYLDVPTMGGATALRAYIGSKLHGTTYPQEYQRIKGVQEAAQEAHPTAANIGTGAGIGASLVTTPAKLATLPGAMAAGAASGAVQAYGEQGTGADAAIGAGIGALGGAGGNLLGRAVSPVVTGAGRKLGLIEKPVSPSDAASAMKQKASGLYDQAKQLGVVVKPQSIANLRNNVVNDLRNNSGYSPNVSGFSKVDAVLRDMNNMTLPSPTGGMRATEFKEIEALRRKVNNTLLSDNEKAVRQMGYTIRNKIDEFIDNLDQHSAHPGAPQAAQLVKDARPIWKQATKLDDIETLYNNAETRAQATYSGGNLDNEIRKRFEKLLEKEAQRPGRWSPEEIAAIKKIVGEKGHFNLRNLLRTYGNKFAFTGLGGNISAPFLAHSLFSGNIGVPLGMVGAGLSGEFAKMGSEHITKNAVNNLSGLVGNMPKGPPTAEILGGLGSVLGGAELPEALIPVNRASGGRVNLVAEAERACKRLGGATKPLMQLDDTHIVNALRLARGG